MTRISEPAGHAEEKPFQLTFAISQRLCMRAPALAFCFTVLTPLGLYAQSNNRISGITEGSQRCEAPALAQKNALDAAASSSSGMDSATGLPPGVDTADKSLTLALPQ